MIKQNYSNIKLEIKNKSFDYVKGRKKKSVNKKYGCGNSKSPRININAKNVRNNYKIQAEKFCSKAQHKGEINNLIFSESWIILYT